MEMLQHIPRFTDRLGHIPLLDIHMEGIQHHADVGPVDPLGQGFCRRKVGDQIGIKAVPRFDTKIHPAASRVIGYLFHALSPCFQFVLRIGQGLKFPIAGRR